MDRDCRALRTEQNIVRRPVFEQMVMSTAGRRMLAKGATVTADFVAEKVYVFDHQGPAV